MDNVIRKIRRVWGNIRIKNHVQFHGANALTQFAAIINFNLSGPTPTTILNSQFSIFNSQFSTNNVFAKHYHPNHY